MWQVMLWRKNFGAKLCPCALVFPFCVYVTAAIWKQFFLVNMSIILIMVIIG